MATEHPVKVVATLGPASGRPEVVAAFLAEGVDVVRLNFSHGTPEGHASWAAMVRRAGEEAGRAVAVLQDLPGPKVRLGMLPDGGAELVRGRRVTLSAQGQGGDLPVDLPQVAELLRPGDRVLLADGEVDLEVEEVAAGLVACLVAAGGRVSSRKGVTLPSRRWLPEIPTPADREAMRAGLAMGVDYMALSYVGSAADIRRAREFLASLEGDVPLVAKIETRRALDNLEEILAEADVVMVARGDLGVELPPEEVPPAQRRIVRVARGMGRQVIVATQMLASMTTRPRPTRAEAADVAQAVWSGADAVMLSDETAAGTYPVEAVRTMQRIIAAAAAQPGLWEELPARTPAESIARAACALAADLPAAALVAATESGFTALNVARFRPPCPIIGLTANPGTYRRLALVWGVTPRLGESYRSLEDMSDKAVRAARELGHGPGSVLVCTAGLPFSHRGGTDLLRIIHIP
jgi:pyruvate kinase